MPGPHQWCSAPESRGNLRRPSGNPEAPSCSTTVIEFAFDTPKTCQTLAALSDCSRNPARQLQN